MSHPNRIPVAVRAGLESREVPEGLAQTTRHGQLLPRQSERIAHDRGFGDVMNYGRLNKLPCVRYG